MGLNPTTKEGSASWVCAALVLPFYRAASNPSMRRLLRSLVLRLENGEIYSTTIREIYRRFHGVDVGLYTIGPCQANMTTLAPGTTVGRYSSVYYTVRTVTVDHPTYTRSTHRLFCDSALGLAAEAEVAPVKLTIGNDVWAGHNAVILPSAESIGDGAVIGGGSVVYNRVPPYAVVTGNPARVVRFRFSEKKIQELLESKWWLKSIDELSPEIAEFQKPLEGTTPPR